MLLHPEAPLFAVVRSAHYWRCYMYGRTFVVHTDLKFLKYLKIQEKLNDWKVRCLELLDQYQFTV